MMYKAYGITRAVEFSPNSDDLTIISKVAACLRLHDCETSLLDEKDVDGIASICVSNGDKPDAVFTMARSPRTLSVLDHLESQGILVINSPRGVRNCLRPTITRLMQDHDVPIPPSILLDADKMDILRLADFPLHYPLWLKRGDASAQQKDDVCFVNDAKALAEAWERFLQRGIRSATVSEHVKGDVVKYYGVAGTPFIYWYYPTLGQIHGKFGLERINGYAHQYPFDIHRLKQLSDSVAVLSDTPVYGGDCIVDSEGQIYMIDFNDWPSFSRCSDEAAEAIAHYILLQINANGNH